MADDLLQLVTRDGLAKIRPGSKDSLAVHSTHFADSYAKYLKAIAAAYEDARSRGGLVDMSITEEPARHYEMATMFYAPGLIGALARLAVAQDQALGRINQLALDALSGARERGAVAWREALQAIVAEIGQLADG